MINVVGAAQDVVPSQPEEHQAVVTPAPSEPPVTPSTPVFPNKKPLDKKRFQLIVGGILLLLLATGAGVASYLVRVNQDVRQQASGGQSYIIPTATTAPRAPRTPNPTASHTPVPKTPTGIPTVPPSPVPSIEPPVGQVINPTETASLLSEVVEPTATPTTASEEEENNDDETPTNAPTQSSSLALAPTLSPTPTLVQTTANCNESCTSDDNCLNLSHICHEGTCRLESNPSDTSCRLPSGGNQIALNPTQANREYTAEAAPAGTGPVSGPADWLRYLQVGAGMLGLGTLLLLFL